MRRTYIEVGEASFEREVIERSREVPVLVDFWAPWCGPCRSLGPILESLAGEAQGRWILAKLNTDENPALSEAYGIRGIPAVKAFVDGVVRDEFTGALPRNAVEAFLQRIMPSKAELLARDAAAAAKLGEHERERELWSQVLAEDPRHAAALLGRARFALADGDFAAARRDLEHVPEESGLHAQAGGLLLLSEWVERVAARGGSEALRERAAANPDDAAARYDFGCALAVGGDFEGALAEFLEVTRRDRRLEDDGGRKAMLAVFALLGDEHELTREFRGRLSVELF
ncbi:MAG: tetratricopeptide repeat protein [Candidatus Eiseniibacteriota bacterium]